LFDDVRPLDASAKSNVGAPLLEKRLFLRTTANTPPEFKIADPVVSAIVLLRIVGVEGDPAPSC
jgi:hypothetical protein